MTETVILDQVTKSYGGFNAISEASFSLHAGESIALVGHNGAGKTTMIKLMLGLIRPTKGAVRVLGEDPATGAFAARLRLGYLPEHVSFNLALTGAETLGFTRGSRECRLPKILSCWSALASPKLRTGGLAPIRKGCASDWGLLRHCSVSHPFCCLMNRRLVSIPPCARASMKFSKMRSKGTTILMSSHALTELETKVGRVIIANKGKIIADGSIDTLRRISQLPLRIRVQTPDVSRLPSATANTALCWHRLGPDIFETEAPTKGKMALVREIVAMNDNLTELDLVPPTLDELYAHFLNAGEAARAEAAE